jgi:hypothetical protein
MIKFKSNVKNDWVSNLMAKYHSENPKQLWDQLMLHSRCSALVKLTDKGYF